MVNFINISQSFRQDDITHKKTIYINVEKITHIEEISEYNHSTDCFQNAHTGIHLQNDIVVSVVKSGDEIMELIKNAGQM